MTLETILKAAVSSMINGHHAPHYFHARVSGQGYVNDGSMVHERAEYLRQLEQSATAEIENIGYASGYSEPGYTDPNKGIVMANWNVLPKEIATVLERAGYAIEWSDEWATCEDCNKLVRTSGNSYHWQPSYTLVDDCSVVCKDCIDAEDYLTSIENNPRVCNVFAHIDPADYGYEKYNGTYESGWHPGQTDDPKKIYAILREKGYTRVLFTLKENSQFYSTFTAWTKAEENDE